MTAAKFSSARYLMAAMALGSSGCASLTNVEELSLYRAIRYETDNERRTHLGSEYVSRFPSGRFIEQMRTEVDQQDEQFWDERRSTLEGIQAYLAAYPSGRHAGEARARIGVYEQERLSRRQAEEEARRLRDRANQEALEARNAAARVFARDTITYWLRATGGINGWGRTLGEVSAANAEFATNYQGAPSPVCRGPRCRKSYQLDFFVRPANSTGSGFPRRLQFTFDLSRGEGGRLSGYAFTFPNMGMATWYERETQTAVVPDQPATRDAAYQWALANLKGIVATVFPDAREAPASLYGPEPELGGDVAEDPNAGPAIGGDVVDDTVPEPTAATPTPAATPPGSAIPPRPPNAQFSYVVGQCNGLGGAVITIPEGAVTQGLNAPAPTPVEVHGCLRIDGYTAIQGVNTEEGLRISWIPEAALPRGRSPRGRTARPARPARPAR
jgi:PAS domain-containing protein